MSKNGVKETGLNYVVANRFYVGIESSISASFTDCQGLGVKVKYETYYEGGVNDQQRILLGQPEFSEVVLKRGLTDDMIFWQWASQVMKFIFGIHRFLKTPLQTSLLRRERL